MTISHLLEDYGNLQTASAISLTDVSLEEHRLEAFEKGYQAGWDDSVKAQEDDLKRVSTDLAQNLHDLTFTYREAYGALLNSLSPLLRQMVETVLPRVAHETLGARVADLLSDLAARHMDQPVELICAPENVALIREMVPPNLADTVQVNEEPSMANGQVFVRVAQSEREIDLADVLQEIDHSVTGFIYENQKDVA